MDQSPVTSETTLWRQLLELLGNRLGMGGLDVMDRAIEQLHGLDQRLDAGIGPLPDYGASGGMRDAIV
jgi:hypothetical protein